jgi:dTDP-4-dehydrorhamnose 3,5-epimerase-like enzyme
MEVEPTNIPGGLSLKPRCFRDALGYFIATYSAHAAQAAGLQADLALPHDRAALRIEIRRRLDK